MIVLFFFVYVGGEGAYGGWVYTYAMRLDLATPITAAYLTSLYWGAFTAGRLLAIPLAARYHPRTMRTWDLFGCLVSLGIIFALRQPEPVEQLALPPEPLPVPDASLLATKPEPEPTLEKLEDTRFN